MTLVIFYEKPGCATNARQKHLIKQAGHELVVKSLLTEAWTEERLRGFFGDLPVKSWFNRAAPAVKSGAVDPDRLDSATAIRLMLDEPLLIRRPLIDIGGQRCVGFDPATLDRLGLDLEKATQDSVPSEGCSRRDDRACPDGAAPETDAA